MISSSQIQQSVRTKSPKDIKINLEGADQIVKKKRRRKSEVTIIDSFAVQSFKTIDELNEYVDRHTKEASSTLKPEIKLNEAKKIPETEDKSKKLKRQKKVLGASADNNEKKKPRKSTTTLEEPTSAHKDECNDHTNQQLQSLAKALRDKEQAEKRLIKLQEKLRAEQERNKTLEERLNANDKKFYPSPQNHIPMTIAPSIPYAAAPPPPPPSRPSYMITDTITHQTNIIPTMDPTLSTTNRYMHHPNVDHSLRPMTRYDQPPPPQIPPMYYPSVQERNYIESRLQSNHHYTPQTISTHHMVQTVPVPNSISSMPPINPARNAYPSPYHHNQAMNASTSISNTPPIWLYETQRALSRAYTNFYHHNNTASIPSGPPNPYQGYPHIHL